MHFRAGPKSKNQTAAGITFFGKRFAAIFAAILSSSPFVHGHTYYSIQLRLSQYGGLQPANSGILLALALPDASARTLTIECAAACAQRDNSLESA
jgi:hypothetical protein